jgi:hypothetical protein
MTRMQKLRTIISEIEKHHDPAELTELGVFLDAIRQKLEIRAMSIAEQRNAVCSAALAKDKATLRKFLHSQFEEIVSWACESLVPPGAAPPWPRVSV